MSQSVRYLRASVRFWLQTAAWLVLMALAFEVLCRLALGHAPRVRIDPSYDRITMPDQPVVQSLEGFSRGHTNELGHLDNPMPSVLPRDGILVIGDSLTEGRQVDAADRFTDRLGRLLGRRVFNVGHTGWSPLNAIAFLRAERARFDPSITIVQLSGNDLEDMASRGRPHLLERDKSFQIVLPDRRKHGVRKLIGEVRDAVSRSAFLETMVVRSFALFSKNDDDGTAGATCAEPDPLVARSLPWVLEQLRGGERTVLLYVPMLDYHAGCVDRCARQRELLRQAAADAGLSLVDVTAALCRQFRETHQPLNGFWNTVPGTGHLNSAGHAVVADELAREIRSTAAYK